MLAWYMLSKIDTKHQNKQTTEDLLQSYVFACAVGQSTIHQNGSKNSPSFSLEEFSEGRDTVSRLCVQGVTMSDTLRTPFNQLCINILMFTF